MRARATVSPDKSEARPAIRVGAKKYLLAQEIFQESTAMVFCRQKLKVVWLFNYQKDTNRAV